MIISSAEPHILLLFSNLFNSFTALPRALLGVNTTSFTPVPQELFWSNMVLFICMFLHDNIQGTELNYPYLLYNERVNFSKFFYHNSAAESLLFTGKTALLLKNSFFSKMAGDCGISLLCFFEVEVILEV